MDTSRTNRGAACATVLLLAACGGGGDGGTPTPGPMPVPDTRPPLVSGTDVPVSATTSADGAFAFVASVAAGSDERAQPLVLGDARLATSESADAKALR